MSNRPSCETTQQDDIEQLEVHGYHLQTERNHRLFWTKLQAICRTNAHLLSKILREHDVRKTNLQYEQSTGKLYDDLRTCPCTSQFMHSSHRSLVTSILLRADTIKFRWQHKFPDFGRFYWLFTDLSRIPWHDFQVSRNSRKVVTLVVVLEHNDSKTEHTKKSKHSAEVISPVLWCRWIHISSMLKPNRMQTASCTRMWINIEMQCATREINSLNIENHANLLPVWNPW